MVDTLVPIFICVVLPVMIVWLILLAIGIALFAVYFVGKRMLAKEIEAEEKALTEPKQ